MSGYWWVNQNQTYRQEVDGGYLWSPKKKAGNRTNPFYEFMRGVQHGDMIFSFADKKIKAIGIAVSTAYGSSKPVEFHSAGHYWGDEGWKVDVIYRQLASVIQPVDYIDELRPFLPGKYSPLQSNGNGLQGVYLTQVNSELANALIFRIGSEARNLDSLRQNMRDISADEMSIVSKDSVTEIEERQVESISNDGSLELTQREALVMARLGQGTFKKNVADFEYCCRVTQVDQMQHLVASHIKPWRYCASAEERLNGNNGLLLTPSIDHLFDRGFITFLNDGGLVTSPVADSLSILRMGIKRSDYYPKPFNSEQQHFLDYHRNQVFLQPNFKVS